MKFRCVIVAGLALALTACGGQDKPAADKSAEKAPATSSSAASGSSTSGSTTSSASVAASTSEATSAAEATSPAAAPMKGEKPSREFVVGKWGTNGDCEMAIDLRADGTSDGPFGNWTYNDGVIGFVEEPDFKVNVTVIDDSTMESTSESSGKSQKMTRCP